MQRKLTFSRKVYLSYLLLLLTFFLVVMPVFFTYLDRTMRDRELDNLNALCEKTVAQLDEKINQINNLSIYITSSPLIRNLLGSTLGQLTESQINDFTGMLLTMHVPTSNIRQRISIYDDQGFFKSTGHAVQVAIVRQRLASPEFLEWYRSFDSTNTFSIIPPQADNWSDDKTYQPLSLVRNLIDSSTFSKVGMVEIQMPEDALIDIVDLQKTNQVHSVLFDSDGSLIYPSEGSDSLSGIPDHQQIYQALSLTENNPPAGSTQLKGLSQDLIVFGQSQLTGWTYCIVLPATVLKQTLLGPYVIILSMMFVILIVMAILTYILSRRLVHPLSSLSEQVQAVTLQNLSISLPVYEGHDEIGQLNDSFNKMFIRLRESMDELAAMRTRELQAHIIALQSQIDPHFIYNILAIISAYSRETGLHKVDEISNRLSAILRYSTRHDQALVSLQDELNHVENYLSLMKLRYEEQFDYQIEGPEDQYLARIHLPRLSLQPIVENSFSHGFRHVLPPWHITVHIEVQDDNWTIEMAENGIGMHRSEIDKLQQRLEEFYLNPADNIKELKLGGMGLINTLARLKFMYKNDFSYQITSIDEGYNGFKISISGHLADREEVVL